jgi:hypothetical protein
MFNIKLKQENAELRADLENCQSERVEALEKINISIDEMALEANRFRELLRVEREKIKLLRSVIRELKATKK